ncbi:hypothetical protein [Bradymonas sediminis]|uniref:hypothetical protein n=1 Tax=Bradymonas sediminis TaxID=1548548 RepID=UPI0013A691E6|nr:hypothetical protein [Bradymonas sediminis]
MAAQTDESMDPTLAEYTHPTRHRSRVHRLKVIGVTARRLLADMLDPRSICHPLAKDSGWSTVAESRSRVWTNDAVGEWRLEAGKVENLRVAVGDVEAFRGALRREFARPSVRVS